jgi:hypothetical protein
VIQDRSGQTLMLYNGATQKRRWRIGWITFDAGFTQVIERCDAPLLMPLGAASATAVAASALQQDTVICLYYTISDDRPTRAILRLN